MAIIDTIKQLIQEALQKNYSSGVPRVPPHTHNKIDNLPVNAVDISGNLVTQIVAGTNVTVSPSTGTGVVTVNSTGGGGGSPGGNNTDVQFNDSGSFGGEDTFTFDKTDVIMTLDNGNGGGTFFGGAQISGGESDLTIITNPKSSNSTYTGGVWIGTGESSGNFASTGPVQLFANHANGDYASAGDIGIRAGSAYGSYSRSGSISMTAGGYSGGTVYGGDIFIAGSNVQIKNTNGQPGYVSIQSSMGNGAGDLSAQLIVRAGDFSYGIYGDIELIPGNAAGHGRGDVHVSLGNILLGNPDSGRGNIEKLLIFENIIGSPNQATNGGILYVDGGALTFLGSSGTLTVIAPA